MNKKRILGNGIILLALLIGLAAFFSGLLANKIGIDPNNGWGLRRIAVLEVGYLIMAASVAWILSRRSKNKAINWVVLFTVLQCLLVYFWYQSAGNMRFITTSQYYDMQAQAYLHGQLDLLQKPSPELLALPDPYDPLQNGSFRLHDAVLYKGRYYLYWGPFPALILAGIKVAFNQTFSDAFLVMLFISGYIVFMALILIELRRKYFPGSPIWLLVSGILFGGLMNPVLWLLARPAVYEAAITGGQFCLLGGIFFAIAAFRKDDEISIGKLTLSGAFFACSVLSRITLVLAVAWAVMFVGYTILKRLGLLKSALKPILAFSIPLMIGATMLFVYNGLRFGSPFELGVKYTLAGIKQIKYIENGSFDSTEYILPNVNAYFFLPTQIISTFPFIVAPWNNQWDPDLVEKALNSSNRYLLVEPVAGMMNTSPLLWLIFAPILFSIIKAYPAKSMQKMQADENNLPDTTWGFCFFAGLALFAFLPVSLEFTASMRYIFDFSSSWFFLAYLGFMYGYTRFGKSAKKILVVCYLVFGAITSVNGLLLGITGYYGSFLNKNPGLLHELVKFFLFSLN